MEQSPWQDITSSSASQIPQLRDPERSLLWSQEPTLVPILKTNHFQVFIFCFLNIYFNILLPSTLWSLHWPLPLRVFYYNVCIFHLSLVCYLPHSFHPSWFDHHNNNQKNYELWTFSLRNFLRPLVIPRLLDSYILFSTFSQMPSVYDMHSLCDRPIIQT